MKILSGRVVIDPISIVSQSVFIEYLEQNATRVESIFKLQIPLLSLKKGYVFFEHNGRVLIRYNSEKSVNFTSLCFFSGKVEIKGSETVLRGSYRFPSFLEVPKYFLLTFAIIWILYFGYLGVTNSLTLIEDSIIFICGVFFFGAGAIWFGNVSVSIFARKMMQKTEKLFERYLSQL